MFNKTFTTLFFLSYCLYTNSATAGAFFATLHQRECVEALKSNQNYSVLLKNFLSSESVFVRHSNQIFISDEERNVLPNYISDLESCMNKFYNENELSISQAEISLIKNSFEFYIATSARLYNKEIAYSEFNRTIDKAHSEQQLLLNQINQENEQAINDSNAAFSSQAMEGVRQIERAFNPPPQRTTNCYAYGNTVRCNSR